MFGLEFLSTFNDAIQIALKTEPLHTMFKVQSLHDLHDVCVHAARVSLVIDGKDDFQSFGLEFLSAFNDAIEIALKTEPIVMTDKVL